MNAAASSLGRLNAALARAGALQQKLQAATAELASAGTSTDSWSLEDADRGLWALRPLHKA